MNICLLHEYVLIKIFSYCTDEDLENLYFVCTLFRWIVENKIYLLKSKSLLVSGHKCNLSRNYEQLSNRDRLKINFNWLEGKYIESTHFHNRKFFATKIFLDNNYFYKSHAEYIRIYRRSEVYPVERRYIKEISTTCRTDITDFKRKDNIIFAGRICGNGFIYEDDGDSDGDGSITEERFHDFNDCITSVDFIKNIFITSSEKNCKLWTKNLELGLTSLEEVKNYNIPFKTIQITNSGTSFYGGKYLDRGRRALYEIDIETSNVMALNSETFSIYDIKLKDDNVIFTANFDSTFRLFDRRTNLDEFIWMDPFDASIYCLEYDGLYGVLCGMKYHARVNLYDIRVPRKHIQMYFPNLRKCCSSPVYSLSCDTRHLYIATDRNIKILDFKADYAPTKDYKNVFINRILIND